MGLPDGPQQSPVLQKLQWIFRPLNFLESCDRKFGDAFTLQLGHQARPLICFSSPEAIQQIFTAPPKSFDVGRANQILRPLLGRRSLELIDGRKHDRQRQLMLPPFHGERMHQYGHLIQQTTTDLIQDWPIGSPMLLRNAIQDISFQLMGDILFGSNAHPQIQAMYQHFDALFQFASSSPLTSLRLFYPDLQRDWGPWRYWSSFTYHREQLDQLLYDAIRQRRQSSLDDLLSMLMQAKDERGQPLQDEDLHSELMTLLFAGHETIATAITWTLYWIHQTPKVLERIHQEIDSLGSDRDPITISQLPYLSAVCNETLRIYPVGLILFPRIVKTPLTIGGYALPRGNVITGCIYLTHQRPDLYPDPHQFRPERFIERKFLPHEYFPFGGGNRRCLGGAFAPFMMKLVVSQVIRQWHLQLLEHRPLIPVRRGVTTGPQGGVRVQIVGPHHSIRPQPLALRQ